VRELDPPTPDRLAAALGAASISDALDVQGSGGGVPAAGRRQPGPGAR